MTHKIANTVGIGGFNDTRDVKVVQSLLNHHMPNRLEVDGVCSEQTVRAILEFQASCLNSPDGRISPTGDTWKYLINPNYNLIPLPQEEGLGYYSYADASRQYGSTSTINTVLEIAAVFREHIQDTEIGVGDISLAYGGPLFPHVNTHQRGTHVDMRPFRKDRARQKVTISDQEYDLEMTDVLISGLRAHENVLAVWFNDTRIEGVEFQPGHLDHIHVRMRK